MVGAGEMAQQLGARTVLAEALKSVPSICTGTVRLHDGIAHATEGEAHGG